MTAAKKVNRETESHTEILSSDEGHARNKYVRNLAP
jgi:hypothetical protein